jgi:hypothetical protein
MAFKHIQSLTAVLFFIVQFQGVQSFPTPANGFNGILDKVMNSVLTGAASGATQAGVERILSSNGLGASPVGAQIGQNYYPGGVLNGPVVVAGAVPGAVGAQNSGALGVVSNGAVSPKGGNLQIDQILGSVLNGAGAQGDKEMGQILAGLLNGAGAK